MITTPCAFIDAEYREEVKELRKEFAKVDRTSLDSLRQWFAEHSYLTTNDLCQIAQVSLRTIQRWRRRLGLPTTNRKPPHRFYLPRSLPPAPADWRAGDWLQRQYPRYSIREIARRIGRSYRSTRRELRRRGVQFRSAPDAVRSKHPCCRKEWLERYYVRKCLSLSTCARLARVSSSTMTAWLLRFEIRVRTAGEQLGTNAWRKRNLHYLLE